MFYVRRMVKTHPLEAMAKSEEENWTNSFNSDLCVMPTANNDENGLWEKRIVCAHTTTLRGEKKTPKTKQWKVMLVLVVSIYHSTSSPNNVTNLFACDQESEQSVNIFILFLLNEKKKTREKKKMRVSKCFYSYVLCFALFIYIKFDFETTEFVCESKIQIRATDGQRQIGKTRKELSF